MRPAPGERGWLVGGTPWPGEGGFAENRSVPLAGLVLIEQADRDELVPLSPARALALLYRCHFPPLWDPVGVRAYRSATWSAWCARCPRSAIAIARGPRRRSCCSSGSEASRDHR